METVKMPDKFIFDRLDGSIEDSREFIAEMLEDRVTAEDFSLTMFASMALRQAGFLILKGQTASADCGAMIGLAANAETYSLYLANYPADSKELEIFLPPRPTGFLRKAVGPNSTSQPDRWLRAFYLCLMRDDALINHILIDIKYETLRDSSTRYPAYRYLQVEAAKALYMSNSDATEKIIAAMRAMELDHLSGEAKEFTALIAMHEAGMMAKLSLDDEDGFNEEVKLALESHIKFYSKSENRRNSPEAWMCIPALGLCALAKRRGFKITTQSPYLPLELIRPGATR